MNIDNNRFDSVHYGCRFNYHVPFEYDDPEDPTIISTTVDFDWKEGKAIHFTVSSDSDVEGGFFLFCNLHTFILLWDQSDYPIVMDHMPSDFDLSGEIESSLGIEDGEADFLTDVILDIVMKELDH